MILNLWTNFEFSNLWNYHFTLYALKCKKVKLIVAKWGVNRVADVHSWGDCGLLVVDSKERQKWMGKKGEICRKDWEKIIINK